VPDLEVMTSAGNVDGVLLGSRFRLDRERLGGLSSCRVVVRYGVGVDNVDLEAAREGGIVVCAVPDYCVEEVSDHALALLLSLQRRLLDYDTRLRAGSPGIDRQHPLRRLDTLSLGIAGLGRIGRALARKARALGMTVIAYDPFVDDSGMSALGVVKVDLDRLLAESDALSLHLPLQESTRGLFGAAQLAAMPEGAILINVGRGGLVDENALAESLASGHLGGAGLDVTTLEPLPAGHPLFSAPNTILTPHVAWYSIEAERELQTKAAEEVARVLGGGTALNPV